MAQYSFLAVGFWVVMVVAVAFLLVYFVGSTRGKRAARMWTSACVALAVLGGLLDILWALLSTEGRSFIAVYGFGPLGEMAMLALLLLGTMWFMAIRYTEGLKD
jgi:hypothetical protein